MSKKKLKKRIRVLEHTFGKLMQREIHLGQRLDDVEEIVFDVPVTTLEGSIKAMCPVLDEDPTGIPRFNMIGPSGDN